MKKERKKGRGDRQRYGEEEMRREKRGKKKFKRRGERKIYIYIYIFFKVLSYSELLCLTDHCSSVSIFFKRYNNFAIACILVF